MKTRESAHDRRILREAFVAVQFDEIFKQTLDEIERVRSIGVSRKLNALECGARFDGFLGRFFFLFLSPMLI